MKKSQKTIEKTNIFYKRLAAFLKYAIIDLTPAIFTVEIG